MTLSYWVVFAVSVLLQAFVSVVAFRKGHHLVAWAFVIAVVSRMLFLASVVLERAGFWSGGMQPMSRFVELISVVGYFLMALYVVKIKTTDGPQQRQAG